MNEDHKTDTIFDQLGAQIDREVVNSIARRAKWCAQPIFLIDSKKVQSNADPDTYGKFFILGCNNRRISACEPCSQRYKRDVQELTRAGMRGGKGVPEHVATHPMIFGTLTAPSFGTVHRATYDEDPKSSCHPQKSPPCWHGTKTSCMSRHGQDDLEVGTPLCYDCYDYHGAVLWNAIFGELWRLFLIQFERQLAKEANITVSALKEVVEVNFVKVAEFQRRGNVHPHAIFRLDAAGDLEAPPPPEFTAEMMCSAFIKASSTVSITREIAGSSRTFTWGDQRDIKVLNPEDIEKVSNYLAKYATKSACDTAAFDKAFRSEHAIEASTAPEHIKIMARTAWRLDEEAKNLKTRRWAHDLGHRGHFISKSKNYSVNFSDIRQARTDYARAEAENGGIETPNNFDPEAKYRFVKQGWKNTGVEYFVARGWSEICENKRRAHEAFMDSRADGGP